MASLKTHISWTDSTWNPTTGCTKASAGCDFCYAEALTNRLWGGNFEIVRTHPARLTHVADFKPLRIEDHPGRTAAPRIRPRRVFVNSMSDLMHKDIPDAFRHLVYDAMEAHPETVFQVLTKRQLTLRRFLGERYGKRGIPAHLWHGVSVEDDRVAMRIDMLRTIKDECGDFTAFLSVEPLIGTVAKHRYDGIDQVLIGGESGPNARPMAIEAARASRDEARRAGAAVWFKQFGTWPNNPLYRESNARLHLERVRHAIERGEREASIEMRPRKSDGKTVPVITGEKGGATLDGEVLHELPPAYQIIAAKLNAQALV